MYSFLNDYSEGAHPAVLEALTEINQQQSTGYGLDLECAKATELLKEQLINKDVDVHYLVGGTQTNALLISSVLKPYQAVIAVDSGHINTHETGAVEYTGHKILTRAHQNGKLTPTMIEEIIASHPDEHMVEPRMVYLSQTTEYGTAYTVDELTAIQAVCKKHQLYLFIDGARLSSSLAVKDAPTIGQLSTLCDAFYIGGTKAGALFGECLVLCNRQFNEGFRYNMKQRGAMLAKGFLLGVQFKALFTNNLYQEIGKHENNMANLLRQGIIDCGYDFYIDSPSNQLFPIFPNKIIDKLKTNFAFNVMDKIDEEHTCIRLVTSWATQREHIEDFVNYLKELK